MYTYWTRQGVLHVAPVTSISNLDRVLLEQILLLLCSTADKELGRSGPTAMRGTVLERMHGGLTRFKISFPGPSESLGILR